MDSTDGLSRGYEVVGTGIQMPVGADVYGRFFNVRCNDGLGNLPKQEKTECQFTVTKIRRFINFIKFYLQVLK
jgi:F0F1-type ATP synthase beta subunit